MINSLQTHDSKRDFSQSKKTKLIMPKAQSNSLTFYTKAHTHWDQKKSLVMYVKNSSYCLITTAFINAAHFILTPRIPSMKEGLSVFRLVGFYGISTFEGYLTPNPLLCKYSVLFQTMQFSMSTQFNCQKHFYFKLFS